MMEEYYHDNREHITEELLLVDLRIRAEIARHRSSSRVADDGFQGLYIGEKEIDSILGRGDASAQTEPPRGEGADDADGLDRSAESLRAQIDAKVKLSVEKGVHLRLVWLSYLYGLTPDEVAILAVCLAPHVDARYQKLFAYLQDDVTRRSPTVWLLVSMLFGRASGPASPRAFFSLQRPLLGQHLLEAVDDPYEKSGVLPTRSFVADRRIAEYLLGGDDLDERLSGILECHRSGTSLGDLALPRALVDGMTRFVESFANRTDSDNVVLSFPGPYGQRKVDVAAAVCAELGVPLLVADLSALRGSGIAFDLGIRLALRESRLRTAALFFEGCDVLFDQEDMVHLRKTFLRELDVGSFLSFLGPTNALNLQSFFGRQRFLEVELPMSDYGQQQEIWSGCLAGHAKTADVDIGAITARYSLTRAQIADAVATAKSYAQWRSPFDPEISQEDIRKACHVHSNRNLDKLAQRIEPRYRWEDLVLEEEAIRQLKGLIDMVTYKPVVHTRWGFERKLAVGKGISALFYGGPGTGKTMAANVIANELGMELYKIDLSTIVSKYIGETEKNLSRIFQEAENSNAVLFFDEADALFGKRTEVKDAHDRYANIEVSYLLQRIDEFSGIVILASNFSQNIDEAFERRLRFIVHFPFPDEQSRLRIWRNVFPRETPLAPDIDFGLIAGKLKIAGGNIANIALTAAFLAAGTGGPVGYKHILEACRNEYRKTGRLWNADELALAASDL